MTQDNRGKRTPGVDGEANLTPEQRMALVGERLNYGDGTAWLIKYADTPIQRHVKVRGDKSPGACPEPVEGTATGRTG